MAPTETDQPSPTHPPAAEPGATPSLGARILARVPRRRELSSDDRRRIHRAVGVTPSPGWLQHFALFLTLSVVIATAGLTADSAAVVIGAMLVAPLMTPILGCSVGLALGSVRTALRSGAVVVGGAAWSVVVAALLARILPNGDLSGEVLARTSPDARDLLVALAAGTAGAYATVREDLSSALPGVAVAVALVPPLATIGVTLETGAWGPASGALLLFATNLAAILLSSLAVFLLTGLVPERRLARMSPRVTSAVALVTTATALVAIPLTLRTVNAFDSVRDLQAANRAAATWLTGSGLELDNLTIDGSTVKVDVSGPDQPSDIAALTTLLAEVVGPEVVVDLRWTQRSRPNDEAPEPSAPPPPDAQAEADRLATADELVRAWLAEAEEAGLGFEITELRIADGAVRVDLTGPVAPPGVDDLGDRLRAAVGTEDVVVNWTQRVTLGRGPEPTNRRRARTSSARRALVDAWREAHPDLAVRSLTVGEDSIAVELTGPSAPPVDDLVARLEAIGGPREVTVWFSERRQLGGPSTPTTAAPPAPGGAGADAEAPPGGSTTGSTTG